MIQNLSPCKSDDGGNIRSLFKKAAFTQDQCSSVALDQILRYYGRVSLELCWVYKGAVPPWNGTVPPWNGTVPPWNGIVPPWNGAVPPWNGTLPPRNGTVPPRNGTVPPWNGTVPPWNGTIPNWIIFTKNLIWYQIGELI